MSGLSIGRVKYYNLFEWLMGRNNGTIKKMDSWMYSDFMNKKFKYTYIYVYVYVYIIYKCVPIFYNSEWNFLAISSSASKTEKWKSNC